MWVIGQRVIAELEPELGLGIIVRVLGPRTIEVAFPGVQVVRQYAQKGAPLRRLVLTPGQRVKIRGGTAHTVLRIHESQGIIKYESEESHFFGEHELDHVVEDDTPISHFLLGHWGHPKTFRLRRRAWDLRARSLNPQLRGLVGPRLTPLPHQLSIAAEAGRRDFPRLLLADEVGLGKTIEAGLIFSSLRALGRAKRVLVIVPEALCHQWLAEMFRRFHETFSLVDEDRCEQETLSQGKSAFSVNQRVICSLEFLSQNVERLQEAAEEPWDLLIVDEAHRLEWSVEEPSVEWEIVSLLAEKVRGLLLLTATPRQHGLETQFGLLHLVDPAKFGDFETFKEQSLRMKETASLAEAVEAEDRTPGLAKRLLAAFPGDKTLAAAVKAYQDGGPSADLLGQLVDRHGTGRVLIRNRRSRIAGFPERQLQSISIEPPKGWVKWFAQRDPSSLSGMALLEQAAGVDDKMPKAAAQEWFEARAKALVNLINSVGGEKILLIVSSPERVEQLQEWLRGASAVRTAIFHEEMEIVERDRQAAWFAEPEGAQLLLSSEIGGEGRNFQFCQHLFLFDLPLHPDVVEQRIGRLDRIGQTAAVKIHVPFLSGTPEEALLRWYSEGLELFALPWNGADLPTELATQLKETLQAFYPSGEGFGDRQKTVDKLVKATKKAADRIRADQQASSDRLIDINSFNQGKGTALAEEIAKVDGQSDLREFLTEAFDQFGVEAEALDEAGTFKLSAHSLTFVDQFPGLSSVGELLATFRREQALRREELAFLTWEHPVAEGAMDLVLQGSVGKVTGGQVGKPVQGNNVVIHLLFVLQATAPAYLELEQDLPVTSFDVVLTPDGKEVVLPPEDAGNLASLRSRPLPPQVISNILRSLRSQFASALEGAPAMALKKATPIVEKASEQWCARREAEIARLKSLSKINPLISPKEIAAAEKRLKEGKEALGTVVPRLDAIRLLVCAG